MLTKLFMNSLKILFGIGLVMGFVMALSGVAFADYLNISLISPPNGSSTTESTLNFTYNATNDQANSMTCYFYLNGIHHATDTNVVSGALSMFTIAIPLGTNDWHVDCVDNVRSWNTGSSEVWSFTRS